MTLKELKVRWLVKDPRYLFLEAIYKTYVVNRDLYKTFKGFYPDTFKEKRGYL